jgi:hypothetical protein
VVQPEASLKSVNSYSREIENFFGAMAAAEIAKTLTRRKNGQHGPDYLG